MRSSQYVEGIARNVDLEHNQREAIQDDLQGLPQGAGYPIGRLRGSAA